MHCTQGAPEYFVEEDMRDFYRFFKMEPKDVYLYGGKNRPTDCAKAVNDEDGDTCGEAMLDIEYLVGVTQQPATFWVTHKSEGIEHFLRWVADIANNHHLERVHSVSFGDTESFFAPAYLDRINLEFQKVSHSYIHSHHSRTH